MEKSFDAVTVSFGVRNFENLDKGIENIYRVLRDGGSVMVLEFSKPVIFPIKQLYNFYFFNVLPIFGKLFSKDNRAYTYLPESVKAFPDREAFLERLHKAGFKETYFKPMGLGICCAYYGKK
jgi:demethylmenaquinone methyltransferase / 2-methoxy-6-polyprenyl-1,4-benzoquinol methylase